MCHFLTISVPDKKLPDVPEQYRSEIHFAAYGNPSVTKFSPIDWTSFTATSGGCSCDLYRAYKDSRKDDSTLIECYRKKGWSESKIERAISSRKKAAATSSGLRDDILHIVKNLVAAYSQIRLSLHWYSGQIETENFRLNDNGVVSLDDFMRENTFFRDESTIKILKQ